MGSRPRLWTIRKRDAKRGAARVAQRNRRGPQQRAVWSCSFRLHARTVRRRIHVNVGNRQENAVDRRRWRPLHVTRRLAATWWLRPRHVWLPQAAAREWASRRGGKIGAAIRWGLARAIAGAVPRTARTHHAWWAPRSGLLAADAAADAAARAVRAVGLAADAAAHPPHRGAAGVRPGHSYI